MLALSVSTQSLLRRVSAENMIPLASQNLRFTQFSGGEYGVDRSGKLLARWYFRPCYNSASSLCSSLHRFALSHNSMYLAADFVFRPNSAFGRTSDTHHSLYEIPEAPGRRTSPSLGPAILIDSIWKIPLHMHMYM